MAVREAGSHQWRASLPSDVAVLSPHSGSSHAALSTRERQVLTSIAKGLAHEQIAYRLRISRDTVDTYVKRARRKLGLGNKAELTRAAVAQQLILLAR